MPPARPGVTETGPARPGATAWQILYGLLVGVVLTVLSVGFVDRPVALFVHAWLPATPGLLQGLLRALTRIPELIGALAIVLIVGLGLLRLGRGGLPRLGETGFLASLSVIVAEAIKVALKLACGRTWPETWVNDNPSFIRDRLYEFHPFHGSPGWGAFPSGHTTAVCAFMTVLWLRWTRWRVIYALAVGGTALGLLGMNDHFLADILAGAYLGWAVGLATVRMGR